MPFGPAPAWMRQGRGHSLLLLYSVLDDRSGGVAYQEYHGVYGEDVEAALRFLFAAMARKVVENVPFQGFPVTLYMDKARRPAVRCSTKSCAIRASRSAHIYPGPRRTAGNRTCEREGRTSLSHRERNARNAPSLPYP